MQQVSKRSLIIVSERITRTVPVPGHHTTRQGGRTMKGREEEKRSRRCERSCDGGEKTGAEERCAEVRGQQAAREGGVRGKQKHRWRGDRLRNISNDNCK